MLLLEMLHRALTPALQLIVSNLLLLTHQIVFSHLASTLITIVFAMLQYAVMLNVYHIYLNNFCRPERVGQFLVP